LEIDLVPANWKDLLDAIDAAGEYVALDLSSCPMYGTEFDPGMGFVDSGTNATGESLIVSLILPDAAAKIKWGGYQNTTFKNFTNLKSISGSKVVTVGDSAFYFAGGNNTLAEVSFPAATSIGIYAFAGCSALTGVSLPAAISIGNNAFAGCSALTELNLPAATSIGDYAFYGCGTLTDVDLPAATIIGYQAFYECNALTKVSLPAATSIGDYAFYGCDALTEVSLPAVTSIGKNAFQYCVKLTNVYLGGAVPTLGDSIFSGVASTLTVHVRVPNGAPAWASETGTFTGNSNADKWGNRFRDGNPYITVTITDSQ
jgi:hypothetical protein